MPLPTQDQVWPPTDGAVLTDLRDWDAWYSGNPDKLFERYFNRGVRSNYDRPSQYRQGFIGRLSRWWWGQPTAPNEKRTKLHIPLAADIARTSSDLLFSEPPKLTADDSGVSERLEGLADGGFQATLLEGGEVCAGLGGAYMRVVWNRDIRPNAWIDIVHADCAVPTFQYGILTSVIFWRVLATDGQTVVRHLECREPGTITHAVYEGTIEYLGKPVSLDAYPETKGLQPVIDLGVKAMTASYVPNYRPARSWRNIPSAAYWGQSDYQGIEGLFDALDETWSSWMRDIRLGKGRITVPASYLESNGPGKGARWDEEREIYTALNMLTTPSDPNALTVTQFDIRTQEHLTTSTELVRQAVRQAGYSSASFGESADGQALTATEIRARERRSMVTRSRKALYWGPAIQDIVEALLAVESGPLFRSGVTPERPDIEFEDSISEDPQTLATTANLLNMAQAASIETRVRLINPDWDDDRVAAEVLQIRDETSLAPLADPTQVGDEPPMPPGEPPAPGDEQLPPGQEPPQPE